MKIVYIAGPYSSDPERNTNNANDVATAVRRAGAAAVVPHALSTGVADTLTEDQWIAHGLALLGACDLVVVLPGYQDSSGTLRELAHANALGIPVIRCQCVSWDPADAFAPGTLRWLS